LKLVTKLAIIVLFIIVLLNLNGRYIFGQESVIRGVVVNKDNQPISDARITLIDPTRGMKFTLKTKKDGAFFKLGIPPSVYKIRVEAEGYLTFESQIKVDIGQQQTLKIELEEKIIPAVEGPDFAQGMEYFEQGDYQRAAESFQKTLERNPASIEASYNLAVCLLRLEKNEEAISILEKAIEINSEVPELYLALGEAYFSQGNDEKARKTFEKALELDPQNYKVLFNLGIIYYKNDQTKEAIHYFEKAKALNPSYSSIYYQEGLAFIKTRDYSRAIDCLEKFLELEPQAPEASQVKQIIEELKKK